MSGSVYDDCGAVAGNATVNFVGSDKKEFIVKTNEDGIFEIMLFPGNYSIQVKSPGFQIFKLEKYRIPASYKGKLNLDIVLEVDCKDCELIQGDPVTVTRKQN